MTALKPAIQELLKEYGVHNVLSETYEQCGMSKTDPYVTREQFWKFINYLTFTEEQK